ncbi:MAG TPA: motility protein A [Candidatus Baltobacteraceae bacterium]|nr:motility protein A [Candidatus Baltobacteraceae bacterium]
MMRMDFGIPIGLAIGLAGIVGSVLIEGGHLAAFANLSAFCIICGGTLGAAMVSTTVRDVLRLPLLFQKALWGWVGADSRQLIHTLIEAATRARKDGILALEEMGAHPNTDRFLAQGIRLVVDGADEAAVRQIMQAEIAAMQRRHQHGIQLLESMGGYAPTMGIIGTVLGLVHVLSKLADGGTETLGEGIAIAFVATLYGIFSANVLLLPLAGNLRAKSIEEAFRREMVLEGILGIQAGDNPHLLELRLNAYFPIPPDDRTRVGEPALRR